ncbi:predicted protein [Botrytis cinerea T4]|uniref:Uncharacterized protein n=1 Tax=Botryotinia fuckeliana (strain T4) TaxID=999810 RepID=G2YWF6_BOTF4|nr:predicted protein [Botrytis cinerea T4]
MQENSPCEGTWVFVEDISLAQSKFSITSHGQDLVRSHPTMDRNEQQNFAHEASLPAIGTILSEKNLRHATEQQMEDLTGIELALV